MNTRQVALVIVGILLLGGLAFWWYTGFSLDFMRFFAAEPGVTGFAPGQTVSGQLCRAPAGCTCQAVQCLRAPCDPIVTCPNQCVPRPACLDAVPAACEIAEPAGGWCPPATCRPRPACLDENPPCEIAITNDMCPPPTRTGMVTCLPATQTVKVGVTANLTAQGGNGSYQWFAPTARVISGVLVGSGGVAQQFSVVYDTAGTKKIVVQSPRGDSSTNVDSVACTITVTP